MHLQFVESKSFWQSVIATGMLEVRYLHWNPVKRGLVKEPGDWNWSSLRHYALRESGVVEIESEWTARDRWTKLTGGLVRTFLIPG